MSKQKGSASPNGAGGAAASVDLAGLPSAESGQEHDDQEREDQRKRRRRHALLAMELEKKLRSRKTELDDFDTKIKNKKTIAAPRKRIRAGTCFPNALSTVHHVHCTPRTSRFVFCVRST